MPHDNPVTLLSWCQSSGRNSYGIKCTWSRFKSAAFDI